MVLDLCISQSSLTPRPNSLMSLTTTFSLPASNFTSFSATFPTATAMVFYMANDFLNEESSVKSP